MNGEQIVKALFAARDEKYREMQIKIVPTVAAERIIGVRTPYLREMAKRIYGDGETEAFLRDLPHGYFDEDQLHAFLISREKDFERCVGQVEAFLPYVDNWATCDQMSPGVFRREKERLLPYIERWIKSGRTYAVRFGIGMLMQHFLDEGFDGRYPEMVAGVRSEEYYVRMMIAWFFATALAKQYDRVIPYIEGRRLEDWTHNKAIQKSVESYRIPGERKEYLRTLRAKK